MYDLIYVFTDDFDCINPLDEFLKFFLHYLSREQSIPIIILATEKLFTEANGWLGVMYSVCLGEQDNWKIFKTVYDKLSSEAKIKVEAIFDTVLENAKADLDYPSTWHTSQIENIDFGLGHRP